MNDVQLQGAGTAFEASQKFGHAADRFWEGVLRIQNHDLIDYDRLDRRIDRLEEMLVRFENSVENLCARLPFNP